jgi:hypothetical protein
MTHPNDRDESELCGECGGLCCALYLAHDEDGAYIGEGWLPDYIELWTERLIGSGALAIDDRGAMVAGRAGIAPLHDPRVSHRPDETGAAYRAALPDGVDVRMCQFCDPATGCLLPRRFRAPICGEWVCDIWKARLG